MKRSTYEATELEAARTVAKYFNPVVGQHDEIKGKRDKHDNPMGADFDLGKDGAFSQFKVLLGLFLGASLANPESALKKKGFQVEVVITAADFVKKLSKCDVAMFLSSTKDSWKPVERKNFVDACVKFHESGKGLWCWTDNDPLFEQANAVLEHFNLQMKGNTPGDKILKLSDGTHDPATGHFKRHVITTGIKTLYEGVTISYLATIGKNKQGSKAYPYAPFKVLAQSTDGHPVSAFLDNEFIEESAGRMLVDGGFTKLYMNWEDAGAARYVVNGVIWLLGLEKKAQGASKKATSKKKPKGCWVWEWLNGDEWTFYHVDDARMLEDKKTEGTTDFSTKDLSFNAKFGTLYKFNLGTKMTQTNTVSSRVTKIRRRRAAGEDELDHAVGVPEKDKDEEEDEDKKEEDEEEEPKAKKRKKKAKEEEESDEEEAPKKKKGPQMGWDWKNGKKWLPFAREDAELLEEKFQASKLKFKTRNLSFNPQRTTLYEYDLEDDTQTNTETGTVTNIRRRKALASDDD